MARQSLTVVGLGFRAQRGGAVVVAVALHKDNDRGKPRVVLSSFLATAEEGDRLALEPYTVAYEIQRGKVGAPSAEAVATVADGRKRQDALAAKALGDLVVKLRGEGFEPAIAALLVNRAGWITDLLAHSLTDPAHPPVIEGLAVREALRFAFEQVGIAAIELDEKSLPEQGVKELGLPPAEIDAELKALGKQAGRPWRKEQKMACLAGWYAISS
jgi:hypothetical protein